MGEFTPDEPAVALFSEKAWLQGALLSGVAYGVELVLFMMSFYLLLRKISGSKDKQTKISLLVYITVMFILSTLFYASNARYTQLAFIDGRNILGGPNHYEVTMFHIPIDELGNVCAVMTTWFCDALIVWRCQIIYTRSKYPLWAIMIFPYLLFLGSLVMGLLFLIQVSAASPWNPDSMLSTFNWTIPFFSLSLSLNIILTGAIVLRLLVYRRRIRSAMGSNYGKHYISAAAMIVESASIFSVFSILFLVPFALKNPLNLIFFQALSVVQIVAMLLIIVRIAQGKGWKTDSENPVVSNQNVSMMRFASHQSLSPTSPVLGSTRLNNRMVHFNGGPNDIDVKSREALEKDKSIA